MNSSDPLPDFLEDALAEAERNETEAHLSRDEAALREVLAQRKIGRMLASALRSRVEYDRLRDSILAATRGESLPRLRARVLAETVESRPAPRAPLSRPRVVAWASMAAAACLAVILLQDHPVRRQAQPQAPELAVTIASTLSTIAQLPAQSMPSLPPWLSPTASMLDQPGLPP